MSSTKIVTINGLRAQGIFRLSVSFSYPTFVAPMQAPKIHVQSEIIHVAIYLL